MKIKAAAGRIIQTNYRIVTTPVILVAISIDLVWKMQQYTIRTANMVKPRAHICSKDAIKTFYDNQYNLV